MSKGWCHMRSALALCILAVGSMSFTSPVKAQAVSPQMRSEATALMKICRADYDRLCNGVQPGGGRVLACLQANASRLSPACAQSMSRAQALKNEAASTGVLPK